MSNFITCRHCSKAISKFAEKCPKCGHSVAVGAQGNCKTCDALLDFSEFHSIGHIKHMVNGTTLYSSYIQHKPCPVCGDKQPLKSPIDRDNVHLVILPALTAISGFFFLVSLDASPGADKGMGIIFSGIGLFGFGLGTIVAFLSHLFSRD
ncbi:hypothetical protein [Desulfonatronum sp. SC1]|uniref:hypothetical protein n=1 Tax=Desulfonatronum sp. SC1 TaxID=2109626 RepID=UPI0011B291C9|nr:hypothetical protein [Desulfonatronum sp. SC1]